MSKTHVYSWRLSRARKAALEDIARAEQTSVADMLDRVTDEWIAARKAAGADDDHEQSRLRAAAVRFVGVLRGRDPERSRQVRGRLRAKLKQQHGR